MSNEKHNQRPKSAVGIKYQQGENGDNAPKIIAKGFGDLADEIIALAKKNGVIIHEDEELAKLLNQLDLGQEIPENLYYIIAELIAFSYVLQGKFPESWNNLHDKINSTE